MARVIGSAARIGRTACRLLNRRMLAVGLMALRAVVAVLRVRLARRWLLDIRRLLLLVLEAWPYIMIMTLYRLRLRGCGALVWLPGVVIGVIVIAIAIVVIIE